MKIQNDRQTTAKYSSVGEAAEASKFVTERILKLDWQPWFSLMAIIQIVFSIHLSYRICCKFIF